MKIILTKNEYNEIKRVQNIAKLKSMEIDNEFGKATTEYNFLKVYENILSVKKNENSVEIEIDEEVITEGTKTYSFLFFEAFNICKNIYRSVVSIMTPRVKAFEDFMLKKLNGTKNEKCDNE